MDKANFRSPILPSSLCSAKGVLHSCSAQMIWYGELIYSRQPM